MDRYLELGKKLILDGKYNISRSGAVYSLFGQHLTFDLTNGFPLLQSKYINFEHIKHELTWYLMGTDKITYLKENGVNIWNAWADENDSIGPTYGVQWRDFNGYDQFDKLIYNIKNDCELRRLIISGWNPTRLKEMALPPCIVLMQFHIIDDELSLSVYQRSADYCLGVPYDIAEMALFLDYVSRLTNKKAKLLTFFYGDLHIYQNHIATFLKEQCDQIKINSLPQLIYDETKTLPECYDLANYHGTKKIKYPISI